MLTGIQSTNQWFHVTQKTIRQFSLLRMSCCYLFQGKFYILSHTAVIFHCSYMTILLLDEKFLDSEYVYMLKHNYSYLSPSHPQPKSPTDDGCIKLVTFPVDTVCLNGLQHCSFQGKAQELNNGLTRSTEKKVCPSDSRHLDHITSGIVWLKLIQSSTKKARSSSQLWKIA